MEWWLAVLCVGAIYAGILYQVVASAIQLRQTTPPGSFVDLGGAQMYFHTSGVESHVTVILMSGSAIPSLLWHPVQTGVARFARVVSYDRAGYGWSPSGPGPRSGEQIVAELRALLAEAGIPGPYLMVGHELAGMYARLFAKRYPDDVAGMVLVDAFEENVRLTYDSTMKQLERQHRRFELILSWLGIMRIRFSRNPTMLTGGKVWLNRFPGSLHPALFGLMYHPRMVRAYEKEWAAIGRSEEELRGAGGLGDFPLAVLSAGRFDKVGDTAASAAAWDALRQRERDGQMRLAGLSTRGRHQIVQDSGHMIPLEQPEAVVSAIRQVLLEIAAQNG